MWLIRVTPVATPVTTPVDDIVATDGVAEVQVPDMVAERVIVLPTHTVDGP